MHKIISDREEFFSSGLLKEIRDRFYYVDCDKLGRRRLFFENSGGSLRLKSCVRARDEYEMIPDCPERYHDISLELKDVKEKGLRDIKQVICGAAPGEGAVISELTASQCMFQMVRAILENAPAGNAVTTSLEHPSAYDSTEYYCARTGREFRVAMANPHTGGVDTEEILRHVDRDTVLLNVMSASNISGYIFNLEEICREARRINPDIFIVTDAVQHVPHGAVDVKRDGIDCCNFAPYKAGGIRGCGYAYVSDRVAALPHHKLIAKPETEWELGTFPHPNFAALSAYVDHACSIGARFTEETDRRRLYLAGMERIHLHEHSLLLRMLNGTSEVPGLRSIKGVTVCMDGPDSMDRDLISAIRFDGIDTARAVQEYYRRGVTVFNRVNTSLYSKRIVESLGETGVIRVSPFHCHDTGDIEEFLRITTEIARL